VLKERFKKLLSNDMIWKDEKDLARLQQKLLQHQLKLSDKQSAY